VLTADEARELLDSLPIVRNTGATEDGVEDAEAEEPNLTEHRIVEQGAETSRLWPASLLD